LFVPAKLHDKFVSDLAAMAERIPMGNPLDAKTQLGPLMTAQRLDDILAQIEVAETAGARVFLWRQEGDAAGFEQRRLRASDDPDPRDELFGPVLCVTPYTDLNEAIGMANDSDYGLASYVWSNDIRESHRIAQELEAGNVFLNAYGYQSEIPFGGYKMSGIGREHGTEAMHEYTQLKSVTVGMQRVKSRFDI
jgi:acyl-CoA reductase-like NAD-dependent aldehyde dehydrogenase